MHPSQFANKRDPKGLYQKARTGKLKVLPASMRLMSRSRIPEIVVRTHEQSAAESVDQILVELLPRLRLGNN